jgi:hypothetical protein
MQRVGDEFCRFLDFREVAKAADPGSMGSLGRQVPVLRPQIAILCDRRTFRVDRTRSRTLTGSRFTPHDLSDDVAAVISASGRFSG